jgi:hypothetical protein
VLVGQGACRFEKGGIVPDGDGFELRSRRAKGVSGDVLAVAMAVEGECSPAGVAGLVAAATAQQTEAARDRDLDRYPVLMEAGDLRVLLGAGHEEDDDECGQPYQDEGHEKTTDTPDVDRHAGPAQRPERLARNTWLPGGLIFERLGDRGIVAAA